MSYNIMRKGHVINKQRHDIDMYLYGAGSPQAIRTTSMHYDIDPTSLWNCTGWMNTIFPKYLLLLSALMIVVESTAQHVTPKSSIDV